MFVAHDDGEVLPRREDPPGLGGAGTIRGLLAHLAYRSLTQGYPSLPSGAPARPGYFFPTQ